MPPKTLDIVDHFAVQSDRYLIVAVVVIGVMGAFVTVRYLVKWIRVLIDELKAMSERLMKIVESNSSIMARNDRSLEQNTRVLQENTAANLVKARVEHDK